MTEEMKQPTALDHVIDTYFEGKHTCLAAFLGVTPQAVGQWVKRGYLPIEQARKVHHRHTRATIKSLVDPEMVRVLCKGKT